MIFYCSALILCCNLTPVMFKTVDMILSLRDDVDLSLTDKNGFFLKQIILLFI